MRIFKYYKELINFKEKGDPTQLLKSVNPGEAFILDAATKCHVRFRLGGDVSCYLLIPYYRNSLRLSIIRSLHMEVWWTSMHLPQETT